MIRLSVDLEPLYGFYRQRGEEIHRPILKHAVALESAGADGIVFGTGAEYDVGRQRVLTTLSKSLEISLAVRASTSPQWLESLREIKPSLAIFRFDGSGEDTLKDFVTKLQVANIMVACEIAPDIELVKKAARIKCDFLVFDCEPYLGAISLSDQIEQLNLITKAAALATRLSMGSIARGEFDRLRLRRLVETKAVEEILLGLPVFSESLFNGYRGSISSLKALY